MTGEGARDTGYRPFDWPRYIETTAGWSASPLLLLALERFAAEGRTAGFAVDLGCGAGHDTVELLRRGWRVLAIDAEPAAIEHLLSRPDLVHREGLEARVAPFEATDWPSADLVNASAALPFCPPAAFPTVWTRLLASLLPGGRFSGHLFGDRDDWASRPDTSHHTRAQVESLLAGLEVERLEETERDGHTALGLPKHWHMFHLVARKP